MVEFANHSYNGNACNTVLKNRIFYSIAPTGTNTKPFGIATSVGRHYVIFEF